MHFIRDFIAHYLQRSFLAKDIVPFLCFFAHLEASFNCNPPSLVLLRLIMSEVVASLSEIIYYGIIFQLKYSLIFDVFSRLIFLFCQVYKTVIAIFQRYAGLYKQQVFF